MKKIINLAQHSTANAHEAGNARAILQRVGLSERRSGHGNSDDPGEGGNGKVHHDLALGSGSDSSSDCSAPTSSPIVMIESFEDSDGDGIGFHWFSGWHVKKEQK